MVYGRLTITGHFKIEETLNSYEIDKHYVSSEDGTVSCANTNSERVTFEELPEPINLQDGLIVIDTKTRSALYKRENGKWLCCALENLNWVPASVTDKDMSAWFERGAVKAL